MPLAALIAASLLSITMTVAAVAKLRDPGAFLMALPEFGLSDRVGSVLARVLPVVELALAAGVWAPPTRVAAGLAGAVLMVVFIAVIAPSVVRGSHVRCACFGSVGSGNVSAWSIARNVALASAALVVAANPLSWHAAVVTAGGVATLVLVGAVVVLVGVVAKLATAQLDVLERYGEVLNRVEALEHGRVARPAASADPLIDVGNDAPDVGLAELDIGAVELATLWAGGQTLLLFTNPGCQSCRGLMAPLADWSRQHPDTTVAVLSPSSPRRTRDEHRTAPIRWLVDRERHAFDAFGVTRTPTAVVVEADGAVSHVARGSGDVTDLLDVIVIEQAALADLEVQSADGEPVRLGDIAGPDGPLLFWNPDCGYCQALRPELAARAAALSGIAGLTAVVSSEWTADAAPAGVPNAVFDPRRRATAKTAAPGTPSLVMVADGVVSGAPAVGAVEVLAVLDRLANQAQPAPATAGARPTAALVPAGGAHR